jgi:hypothetical protein
MTTADFLKRLCEGYVRAYRTLNLRTRAMWTDHTKRELEFFAHLGGMLGFAATLEHERMDLSWRDVDGDEALVLYLERERFSGRALGDTLHKLLDSDQSRRARYLVGVFGWVTDEILAQAKQAISERRNGRPFLLIAWVGPNE